MRSRHLTGLAGLAIVAALALAGCSGSDSGTATDPEPSTSPTTSPSASTATGTSCDYADGAPASKEVDPPPAEATRTGDVTVTISTSIGDLGATLDAEATPCTVNSFVSLAQQGYFDDTSCHRLTTSGIAVLQCGDPTGTGTGGPGYTFPDELSGQETYPAGTLAMANAGPDTNGSQFFIVYGETPLPPSYAVFGQIDDAGIKAVEKVAKKGSDDANGPGDGHPKTPVDITSVTVAD